MKYLVTGAAGFVGSSIVDRLLGEGHHVVGIDNFSTGFLEFLTEANVHEHFEFIEGDLIEPRLLLPHLQDVDVVIHFAANADVRFGTDHPGRDLEQNTIVTFNVLEAMRSSGVKKLVFSSTGSVYGESKLIPTPEDAPFPIQTSLYGASKSACEGLITAYCEGFGFQSWIFRFVSILGERYTHGHIYDFYKKLKSDPTTLGVLGDGRQKKSYLYIQDCIDAILIAMKGFTENINVVNLGVEGICEVNESISVICAELKVKPELEYSGGRRGWIGDNPLIQLDTTKIRSLNWSPKLSINEAILRTVRYLRENEWVLDERE